MSGGIPFRDRVEGVDVTLKSFDTWLAGYFDIEPGQWKVAFNEEGKIGVRSPSAEYVDLCVIGELTQEIPEAYANDDGDVRTPIFPVGLGRIPDTTPQEETKGHRQILSQDIIELCSLDDVSPSPNTTLERIIDQSENREIVDAFGTAWSERDSLLASRVAEKSLKVEHPEAVIGFDILRRLTYAYQYQDYLRYTETEDGEVVREDTVTFEKIIEATPVSDDDLPVVDKVYVHQDSRVTTSHLEVTTDEIADSIQERVLGSTSICTIPDPGDIGIRAQVGSIVKLVLDEDDERYNGFVRTSSEVEVSLLYDFYAALDVPDHPFISFDLSQRVADWEVDRERFSGWSSTNYGFAYDTTDTRREIHRQLFANKYWVLRGERYRKKSEFEEDVEYLIDVIESELDCTVSWRRFGETRISKPPITQTDVLGQIRSEARAPVGTDELIQATNQLTSRSQDVDGIDGPLFPSDLTEFVADTSIIDAQVISRMVAEGDLYNSNVIVPDVVLEEIHRQVEKETSRGKLGLEELTSLRELAEMDIINLEIVEADLGIDTEDNVAVDQALIRIARRQDIPLCSADQTLLEIAGAAGVQTYPLNQELSRWDELITNELRNREEIHIAELVRSVYSHIKESRRSEEDVHRALFDSPGRVPTEDLATEMAIRDQIDQLVRRGELYQQGDLVGLKKTVAVVPSLEAVKHGVVSDKLEAGEFFEITGLPPSKIRYNIYLPNTFERWATLQEMTEYTNELHTLEDMERSNDLQIQWRDIITSEQGIFLADEDQFANVFHGLQRDIANEFNNSHVLETNSGSLTISY